MVHHLLSATLYFGLSNTQPWGVKLKMGQLLTLSPYQGDRELCVELLDSLKLISHSSRKIQKSSHCVPSCQYLSQFLESLISCQCPKMSNLHYKRKKKLETLIIPVCCTSSSKQRGFCKGMTMKIIPAAVAFGSLRGKNLMGRYGDGRRHREVA